MQSIAPEPPRCRPAGLPARHRRSGRGCPRSGRRRPRHGARGEPRAGRAWPEPGRGSPPCAAPVRPNFGRRRRLLTSERPPRDCRRAGRRRQPTPPPGRRRAALAPPPRRPPPPRSPPRRPRGAPAAAVEPAPLAPRVAPAPHGHAAAGSGAALPHSRRSSLISLSFRLRSQNTGTERTACGFAVRKRRRAG